MRRKDFDGAVERLTETWRYGSLEVECLWEAVKGMGLAAFMAGLKARIQARRPEAEGFKPPMSSIIAWLKQPQGRPDPTHAPEYVELMERIQAGEVTSLFWKVRGRDYPCLLMAGGIYLDADPKPYPPRFVAPKTLGIEVLVPPKQVGAVDPPALEQDYELAPRMATLTWEWCRQYTAATGPKERREAIKAYYLARDRAGEAVTGKEDEALRALLDLCDVKLAAAGLREGVLENPGEKPPHSPPTRPADEEPDACEKMLGPDVHEQQRRATKMELPF